LGEPLEGPVLQQRELSMVCVGLCYRQGLSQIFSFGGPLGVPGKILGGQWPPVAPPLLVAYIG